MTDWVSLVNIWCQQNKREQLTFTFCEPEWSVVASAPWLSQDIIVEALSSKKEAKQACCEQIYKICKELESISINRHLCILVDGDQRMDCWRWLTRVSLGVTAVRVYISPTTPVIDSNNGIEVIKAFSATKDSADARMLLDLGGMLATNRYQEYAIVSSDHMLVQVANDLGIRSLAHLNDLLNLFRDYDFTGFIM